MSRYTAFLIEIPIPVQVQEANNFVIFHPYKQRVRKCSNNLFLPLCVYTCLCITWGVKYSSLWGRNLGLLKSKALKGMKLLF